MLVFVIQSSWFHSSRFTWCHTEYCDSESVSSWNQTGLVGEKVKSNATSFHRKCIWFDLITWIGWSLFMSFSGDAFRNTRQAAASRFSRSLAFHSASLIYLHFRNLIVSIKIAQPCLMIILHFCWSFPCWSRCAIRSASSSSWVTKIIALSELFLNGSPAVVTVTELAQEPISCLIFRIAIDLTLSKTIVELKAS